MRIEPHDGTHPTPSHIVAIRPGALGDTLLLFPTLAILRRTFPATRLTFVTRSDVLPLASASGLADATSAYDNPEWSALFADQPDEDAPARKQLAGAVAIAWLADHDGHVARNLKTLGAMQTIVAAPLPQSASPREHVALYLARALAPLGVETPTSVADLIAAVAPLTPAEPDERSAKTIWQSLHVPADSTGVVALHPGSGGAAKRWPTERFAALASAVHQMGYVPLVLEGPQDAPITSALAEHTSVSLPVARDLSIGALAALLKRCAAYVGNDSGVSHLAGMVGVRTLALFGPTDPLLWEPLGPHVSVIQAPDGAMKNLSVRAVTDTLSTLLQN